jgi:hypothetical protein
LKVNHFSDEHIASIFRVKELAKRETSIKLLGSRALLDTLFMITEIFFIHITGNACQDCAL